MDAGQKSDGRAAGNDFAGLNGAEAAFRAIEDGPGDLGFEALVGKGDELRSQAISSVPPVRVFPLGASKSATMSLVFTKLVPS